MGEALSPNPQKQQRPPTARVQSPTAPFFLGSNDDKLERAQARAARAAAIRRKSIAASIQHQPSYSSSYPIDENPCLDKLQILELYQNCIKLASENVSFLLVFLNSICTTCLEAFIESLCVCWNTENKSEKHLGAQSHRPSLRDNQS